ncbi:MFS transporter [Paenibacillus sp. JX-17]|uniref:MFS transporter n=1 Tax=Paenibacillus lacisoli TaxID=3064525 RepID=A0ABT9CD09_9BACL|nr:MFS transporter [Paenibacillus sp. JX-17]MDO7907158.1 MFS transporter [Paenibacillus sp. JX-17]
MTAAVNVHKTGSVITMLFLIMFLIGTDTFIVSPLLPAIQSEFHMHADRSGWLVGAYALGYSVFALIAGPLSDRLDRRNVMLIGLTGFAAATFLCGFTWSFGSMVLFRLIAGMCAAMVTPQVWAAVPMLVPPAQLLRTMGFVTAGLAGSQALGVPLGAWLADIGSWQLPFWTLGIAGLVMAAGIAIQVPPLPSVRTSTTGSTPSRHSFLSGYRQLLSLPAARYSFTAYFLFQLGNFGAFSYIGTWLHDRYQASVGEAGTIIMALGVGNLMGSVFGSRWTQRIGIRTSLYSGILVIAFLYVVLSQSPGLITARVLGFLMFTAAGAVFPIMMTILQSYVPSARGLSAALSNSIMYLGTTAGSAMAGWLYVHSGGFLSVTTAAAGLFVLSVLFWMVGSRPMQRHSDTSPSQGLL